MRVHLQRYVRLHWSDTDPPCAHGVTEPHWAPYVVVEVRVCPSPDVPIASMLALMDGTLSLAIEDAEPFVAGPARTYPAGGGLAYGFPCCAVSRRLYRPSPIVHPGQVVRARYALDRPLEVRLGAHAVTLQLDMLGEG